MWGYQANKPKIEDYSEYVLGGYTLVHNLVANLVLRETTATPDASISLLAVPMRSNTITVDKFTLVSGPFANLIVVMYILPVYNMVFFIVKEKEQRAKESMRMMGLGDWSYWVSWFVYYTVQNTVMSAVAWATLRINVF